MTSPKAERRLAHRQNRPIRLLALAAACLASAYTAGEPLASSSRVHAFYYPWYGNPETDGRWSHWDHRVLLRGGGGRSHSPPGDIGANFYPELGPYSSNSRKDLAAHMRHLGRAGVGVIAVSWWGRGSFEDRALARLFEVAAGHGVRICLHIEPYAGRNGRSLRADLAYLLERFGDSPALYRRPAPDGRPLVYLYDSYLVPARDWASVLAPGADQTIRGTPLDAAVIALWVKEGDGQFMLDGHFDGYYTYFATVGFTFGSTPGNWPALAELAREHDLLFIPSVGPGYDDTRIRPWNTRNRRDRRAGAYYDEMFAAALRVSPAIVSITSFNEWHEGTQIEPAVPRQSGGFAYEDYSPLAADHYLRRTAHWADLLENGAIVTVRGPVPPHEIGRALVHEHILCDFSGAEVPSRGRYEPADVISAMRPHLEAVRDRGFGAFFDCTPAFIGRDVKVLRELAGATGLHLITNTGYYGAAGDKFLPPHAFTESAEDLADRWVQEWHGGIDGTDVRPGFLKIGVDGGHLSDVDARIVRAAARAHLRTGLTIACHTGESTAAREVLRTVLGEGVAAGALVIVHADGFAEPETHRELARAGAWVEFDGIREDTVDTRLEWILDLAARGLHHRLLVSHDAGWYRVGEPGGASERVRPFTAIADRLLPALEARDGGSALARRLLVDNPADAFRVRVRRR